MIKIMNKNINNVYYKVYWFELHLFKIIKLAYNAEKL